MKTSTSAIFAAGALLAACVLPSCSAHVDARRPATGAAVHTTTTTAAPVVPATSVTTRRTTTTY